MKRLLLLGLSFLSQIACGQAPARQAADRPLPRVIAYPWMSLEKWREFHAGDLARADAGPAEVLFIGDSITEAWDKTGLRVWEKVFAPMPAANFGIGGDTTQNVLWRITEGRALEKVRPQVVVLLIGTNNLGLHNDSPETVARGVAAVVKTLRRQLPESRILLLDLFPRGVRPTDQLRLAVAETNRLLQPIGAGDDHVRHLRIWDEFLEKDGTISRSIMPDALHLSEAGYRIWAETMQPVMDGMMRGR